MYGGGTPGEEPRRHILYNRFRFAIMIDTYNYVGILALQSVIIVTYI